MGSIMKEIVRTGINIKNIALYAVLLISMILISCSGDPGTDVPYGNVNDLPQDNSANPFVEPADEAITDLSLLASVDYDRDTGIVSIYFKVLDQNDNIVDKAFNTDNFQVYTSNSLVHSDERTVTHDVTSAAKLTGLILDSSGSMSTGTRQEDAIEAAIAYVDQMAGSDQTAYIYFNTHAAIRTPLTDASAEGKLELTNDISDMELTGLTNIGGGIIKCVSAVGARPGKTAGILVTDGQDTEGFINAGIKAAQSINMPIYTIAIGEEGADPGKINGFPDDARIDMQKIADDTGGTFEEIIVGVGLTELSTHFGTTLPGLIVAQTPVESSAITFANQFSVNSLISVEVTLSYQNAWGWHRASFVSSYLVQPATP